MIISSLMLVELSWVADEHDLAKDVFGLSCLVVIACLACPLPSLTFLALHSLPLLIAFHTLHTVSSFTFLPSYHYLPCQPSLGIESNIWHYFCAWQCGTPLLLGVFSV